MTQLNLKRTDKSDKGVFGQLLDGDTLVAFTCERPDNGNQAMGCIPVGQYKVVQHLSPHNGQCFLILNVPDRTMIEIHKGNTINDIKGCIVVGTQMGSIVGVKAVLNSALALSRMLEAYPDGFDLDITEE